MSTPMTPDPAEPGERDVHTESLTGHVVLDDHHHRVGTVSDVLYDERGEPAWAVVDPGVLRAEKYVPVEGAYLTESGELVIPYDRDQVKHAPKAGRDHVLDARTESDLVVHYELQAGQR